MVKKIKLKLFSMRMIALKLYKYFVLESKRNRLFHKLSKPIDRVLHALKLNKRTFMSWIEHEHVDRPVEEINNIR